MKSWLIYAKPKWSLNVCIHYHLWPITSPDITYTTTQHPSLGAVALSGALPNCCCGKHKALNFGWRLPKGLMELVSTHVSWSLYGSNISKPWMSLVMPSASVWRFIHRSGPYILRPLLRPEKCSLKLQVILKWKDTCTCVENIRLLSLIVCFEIRNKRLKWRSPIYCKDHN